MGITVRFDRLVKSNKLSEADSQLFEIIGHLKDQVETKSTLWET